MMYLDRYSKIPHVRYLNWMEIGWTIGGRPPTPGILG
jgi:hypothetical protein